MTQTEINVPVDGTITSAKLSGALTTPSTLVATGKITASAGIALPDSQKVTFGASDDLQIYHDGSNSRIVDAGTGIMTIQASSQLGIYNADGTQVSAEFVNDGKVGLRFSGSEKLATTSTGIDVTGTATATKLVSTEGVLELDDNGSHNGVINVPASLFINIDSDNGATGEDFVIAKDRTSTSGGTELFRVQEDGNVGIGVSALNNPLEVGVTPNTTSKTSGSAFDGAAIRLNGNLATTNSEVAIIGGSDNGIQAGIGFVRESASNWGSAIKFYTRQASVVDLDGVAERLRISSDGIIVHNGVSTYSNGLNMMDNQAYSFDIPVGDEGGSGNVIEVHAMYDHYFNFGYGASLITLVGKRGTNVSRSDIKVVTTTNGGAWTVTAPNATTLRLTKSAGSYGGGGFGHIMVRFRKS